MFTSRSGPSGLASSRARLGTHRIPTIRYFVGNCLTALSILLTIALPAASAATPGAAVQVNWAANPETDIAGYRLLYGTAPGEYGQTLETAGETTATIDGLANGTTYYFALKAINTSGMLSQASAEVSYTTPAAPLEPVDLMPRSGWSVVAASSVESSADMAPENAFDGDPETMWHSAWTPVADPLPHWIEVDIGQEAPIRGFRYLPRPADFTVGNIAAYEFLTSIDGSSWSVAASGTFASSADEKEVLFPVRTVRFFRLRALSEVAGRPYTSVPEFNLILGGEIVTPPGNNPPVANARSLTTAEDQVASCILDATDPDDDALTYEIVTPPAKGVLSGTAPNLTYTPNANANGSDSFTFRVNDGTANSNTATVSITITALNDAPVASSKSVTTSEDTPVSITLSASDVEGSALTYSVLAAPSKGTLSGSAPNLTYTPHANANGSDSFTFRANDGTANSNTATVSIIITPVNDAPVASSQSVTTKEETAVSITLAGSDVEASPLSFTIVSQPSHGVLSGAPPTFRYEPGADFTGTDSFTFRASDGALQSTTATVSIVVAGKETSQDDFVLDRSGWTLVSVDTEETPNYAGARAIDGNTGTFWHTRFKNDATPPPHEIVVDLGEEHIIHGFRYLPRQDPLTIGNIEDYEFQTSRNGNAWSVAAAGAFAADAHEKEVVFTARAARYVRLRALSEINGNDHANIAELNVLGITGENRTPEALAVTAGGSGGGPVGIKLAGRDPDLQPLSFKITRKPRHGDLQGEGADLVYQPDAGFNGSDSFMYVTSDGLTDSDPATVVLTIEGNIAPPRFRHSPIDAKQAMAGRAYTGGSLKSELATTGSAASVVFRKVSGPAWLKVSPGGTLYGKAPADASGRQTFKVRAINGDGASAETALRIMLRAVDRDKLPSGWRSVSPGGAKGVAKKTKSKTTVSGTGELTGRKDEGYFVSKRLRGNGSITVRLSDVRGAGSLARAGVMIRRNDRADSPYVFVGTNANGSLRIARRSKAGGATAQKTSGGKPHKKIWLRLKRSGNKIDAYTSDNGRRWKKVGSHKVKLGRSCRVGLWVSGGGKRTGKATFRKLKIQP